MPEFGALGACPRASRTTAIGGFESGRPLWTTNVSSVIIRTWRRFWRKTTWSNRVLDGARITQDDARALYGLPLQELGALADCRRQAAKSVAYGGRGGEIVTYIVDRNVNYTNAAMSIASSARFTARRRTRITTFLALSKSTRSSMNSRPKVACRCCSRAAITPIGIDFYLDMLAHIRAKYPQINIHGFSPPEFNHFSQVFGMPLREVIERFQQAGWGRFRAEEARFWWTGCAIASPR